MMRLKYEYTLRTIDDEKLITRNTRTRYFPQCNDIATTSPKCNTKATICDDSEDTCATIHETWGMNVKDVYMTSRIHQNQSYPLK